MVKKQGDRLKQSETKSNIIKYILENNGPIGEPDIRKHLYVKYEIKDQSRINRHLHELKEDNYIELIPPTKTGLRNKWNITKFEHLENIKRKGEEDTYFKKISLNEYEKSLMIICKKRGHNIRTLEGLKIYNRMRLLPSYFNMCMDTDIQTLYNRVWVIYLEDNEFKDQYFKKPLSNFYITFIKDNPKIGMHDEAFYKKMMGSLVQEHKNTQGENSIEDSQLTMDEDQKNLLKEGIRPVRDILAYSYSEFNLSIDNLLLYYLLNYDRVAGIYSPEAIDFTKKIRKSEAIRDYLLAKSKNQEDQEEVTVKWFLSDLRHESELILKYKQPSIFSENHKTSDEVYQGLIDFFDFRTFLKHSHGELLS